MLPMSSANAETRAAKISSQSTMRSSAATGVLRPGAQLGHYRLVACIGRGGMGEVWHARATGPGGFARDCALKLLAPELGRDRAAIDRFLHEATVAARLHHPSIVSVYDFGRSAGCWFIAMERIVGCDLREMLRAMAWPQPWSVGFAAYVTRELALALHHAHTLRDERGAPLGLVHCDVTPSNIMLTYDGAVKLLDFGVARSRDHLPPDAPAGKWAYMAPEQLRAEALDHRADVFAAGVVLWESLTCRRLFQCATTEELRRRRDQGDAIAPPSRLNPRVPATLDRIVLRALAPAAAERYADCRELAAALDPLVWRAAFDAERCSSLVRSLFVDDAPTMVRVPAPPDVSWSHKVREQWRRFWHARRRQQEAARTSGASSFGW